MLEIREAEARAAALVEAAIKAGADAADALYAGDASNMIQVRLGALEEVARAEGEEIGLRLFVGQRTASVSSSDLSTVALAALVERAIAMAREATEDPFAGMAPQERLFGGAAPDLEADDGRDPSSTDLKVLAGEIEDAARSVSGITNSEGAGVQAGRAVVALATSHGFARGYSSSFYSAGVSVIAGEGGEMQRDHASHQVRHLADLDTPERLGRLAAERAIARLKPGKLPSGTIPVLYDPRVGGSLISHLLGAMSGPAVARRMSFLAELGEEELFPGSFVIIDDPHRRRGLRSKPFDGEGVATVQTELASGGRLRTWLLNTAAARQLGLETSGHATRSVDGSPGVGATNVHLQPGAITPAELMADVERGLYVTELIGQGVNLVTGDYSRGAAGFVIAKGELTQPVAEVTIAGNLGEMFARLSAANDLEHRRTINVPSLRIEGMTVASA